MTSITAPAPARTRSLADPAGVSRQNDAPNAPLRRPAAFDALVDTRLYPAKRPASFPGASPATVEFLNSTQDSPQLMLSFAEMSMFGARPIAAQKFGKATPPTRPAVQDLASAIVRSAMARPIASPIMRGGVAGTAGTIVASSGSPKPGGDAAHVPANRRPAPIHVTVSGQAQSKGLARAAVTQITGRAMPRPALLFASTTYAPVAVSVGASAAGLVVTSRVDRMTVAQLRNLEREIAKAARAHGVGINTLIINGRRAGSEQ